MDETHAVIQPLQQCGLRLWKGLFSHKRMKQLDGIFAGSVLLCGCLQHHVHVPMCSLFLSVTHYGTYVHIINKTITSRAPDVWFIHVLEVTTGSKAEHGEKDEWERSEKTEWERDAYHYEARLRDSQRSHVLLLSPLDDPAPLCLHWEKGNGRRIYCWVLTCTHSWCCFSPLGPLAIPKASKTTGCQVVTAGFKQLLQQPCT